MKLGGKMRRRKQGGYILLTLLLMVSLMVVAAAMIVPTVAFQIKRDREQELIHRGVQYSRAIRTYYKKFGRYPAKIEDLQSSNNTRFLRKRYKDPVTGKDFKLLHFGEVKMSFGGISGGSIPGANSVGALNNQQLGGPSNSGFGPQGGLGGNSGFGNNSNSGFGSSASSPSSFGSTSASNSSGNNQTSGTDATSANTQVSAAGSTSGAADQSSSQQQVAATFGGMPIVGVVSTSKKDSIREFNHKKKYNEWQFIYDPSTDRGGLLNTPNQPPLQGFGQNGQPGQLGQPGSSNSTSFGASSGFNNNPSGFGNNSNPSPPPSPPPSNPPQQQ